MKTVLLIVTTFLLMSSVGVYAVTVAETGPLRWTRSVGQN